MKLKICSLLSAFILVNTLSDWNLPGSCLSQTGSRALPSQIPIRMPSLITNWVGEGLAGHQEMARGRASLLLGVCCAYRHS